MKLSLGLSTCILLLAATYLVNSQEYDATWESIDSREMPAWYDQSKIGIFIHWGVYSVPAISSEWFWWAWIGSGSEWIADFMAKNYRPGFTYQDFATEFTAEFYDPDEWASLFERAGAKYVVLTSKHHEGYTLWPSKYSFSWSATEVGPKRDLVGDLATAVRNIPGLRFGLYHSYMEWFNPLWMRDVENNFATSDFVDFKTAPGLYEVVEKYHPDVIWSDGEWEATDTYWKSKEFLAWLFNDSPVKEYVVINDRWGNDTRMKHGGFWTGGDRYNPGVIQPHKWENCFTLDKESWGYRRNAKFEDYLTPEEVITTIIEGVSCGGNVLVNVGPTKEGTIPIIQQERLLQMGEWLRINGDAIYNTIPHTVQNDTLTPGLWYTTNPSETIVYAMMTKWPGNGVRLGSVEFDDVLSIRLVGNPELAIQYFSMPPGIFVTMPNPQDVISKWAWTLEITVNQKSMPGINENLLTNVK